MSDLSREIGRNETGCIDACATPLELELSLMERPILTRCVPELQERVPFELRLHRAKCVPANMWVALRRPPETVAEQDARQEEA